MAYKAVHLRRGSQNIYITVEKLFAVAFGSSQREYDIQSLLGWRPVLPHAIASILEEDETPSVLPDRPTNLSPGVKIFETDVMILVEVELPPINEDSLYIEISGDLLIIRGQQTHDEDQAAKKESEFNRPRMVYRYIQLPVIAKSGRVRARLEGNTVRVKILKQGQI